MTKEHQNNPTTEKIRRRERAKDDAWIEDFLLGAPEGTMASVHEGKPYLVTRNYAYDKKRRALYMHGAQKGRTFEHAQKNNQICFTAHRMGRLLPAARAMNFSVEYRAVVAFGHIVLVSDPEEAKYALQLIVNKYFPHLRPGEDYEVTSDTDLKVTAVFRIDIERWSGKEKIAPDDFPGAFYMDET
jgi:nitroimidazol reductase NimA-like FMN-containing flavoprotein (pyridoxamine 5'-phosphate oxidase superfamily)